MGLTHILKAMSFYRNPKLQLYTRGTSESSWKSLYKGESNWQRFWDIDYLNNITR